MTTQNQDPNQISDQNSGSDTPVDSSLNSASTKAEASESVAEKVDVKSTPVTPKEPPSAPPTVIVESKSKGGGLSVLALAVSLIALGASGALFYQGQQVLKNMENAWGSKLSEAGMVNAQNQQQLKQSFLRQDAIAAQMLQFDDRLNQSAGQYNTLNQMYQELTKTRYDWLMAETEYTLNLASQQLQLSGNVPGAITALESIEQRLSKFDRPELIPLKRAISSDLVNLKKQPYLDVTGLTLKLDRLQTALSSLPMVLDGMVQSVEKTPIATPIEGASWWENLLNEVGNGLKDLVQVQQINSSDALLLSPEQSFFIKENIKLRILDARLALMQHQGDIYQNDLDAIESALKNYFDQSAPATQTWLKELAELKAASFDTSTSGLNASIQAVRAYQAPLADLPTPVDPNAATAPQAKTPTTPNTGAPSQGTKPYSNTVPPADVKSVEPMPKGQAL